MESLRTFISGVTEGEKQRIFGSVTFRMSRARFVLIIVWSMVIGAIARSVSFE